MSAMRTIIIVLIHCFLFSPLMAQKKVRLEHADMISGGRKDGERFEKLIGNVILNQDNSWIYCDSATRYPQRNHFEAFGKVRIQEGDSITITARRLIYTGNTRHAQLRNNVVFTKLGQMTLYTDDLRYDRNTQIATYRGGGKLVDSTNTLTSVKGYFNNNNDMASFKKNVEGYNDDYTLKSDTLQYHTVTKVIYFRDHTELVDTDGNVLTYNEGTYDTRDERSILFQNTIETNEYILQARKFITDDVKGVYQAREDVVLINKENDVIITGEKGDHYKETKVTKIYDNALMKMKVEDDTLYLRADTLVNIDSDYDSAKRLLAYYNVRIFKSDLQGRSDSLAYFLKDSVIYFYQNPILWSGVNQMSADSINIEIKNKEIDKLNMAFNSFVVSQDTLMNYNQVKGRFMTAFFEEGDIKKVEVTGNGESIYFALNEKETRNRGMNKVACSNMTIHFVENELDHIIFYVNPDGAFIPPHELKESEKYLKGFAWTPGKRPEKIQLLRPAPPMEPPVTTPESPLESQD